MGFSYCHLQLQPHLHLWLTIKHSLMLSSANTAVGLQLKNNNCCLHLATFQGARLRLNSGGEDG